VSHGRELHVCVASALGQKRTFGTITTVQESNAATRGKVTLISVNSPGCVSTSSTMLC